MTETSKPTVIQGLAAFLSKAHKARHSNLEGVKSDSTRPGSSDYHFHEGAFTYHDTCFGSHDFIGEEIIYKDDKPVWGMNYVGSMLDENVPDIEVVDFLEKSIMQENDGTIPVRGPKEFSENGWGYQVSINGGLDRFTGVERISRNKEIIYKLYLQGGFIQ